MDPLIFQRVVDYLRGEGDWDSHTAEKLTKREKELLPFIARGKTNAQIAEALNISPTTVKTHMSNILHKLGISDRSKIPMKLAQQDPKSQV